MPNNRLVEPRQAISQHGQVMQDLLPDLAEGEAPETTKMRHSSGGIGEAGLPGLVAHNGILVIDWPTEFSRETLDAQASAAAEGETVVHRPTPIEHTIRTPARFRLMATRRADKVQAPRHRTSAVLDLYQPETDGRTPRDAVSRGEQLLAARARIRRAAAIFERTPPRSPRNTGRPPGEPEPSRDDRGGARSCRGGFGDRSTTFVFVVVPLNAVF